MKKETFLWPNNNNNYYYFWGVTATAQHVMITTETFPIRCSNLLKKYLERVFRIPNFLSNFVPSASFPCKRKAKNRNTSHM